MSAEARQSRQDFLGSEAPRLFRSLQVGIVGLGGGGSHVAQQLAHVGFQHYALFDADRIQDTNLNRLVGATQRDVEVEEFKVHIAKRVILGLNPRARVEPFGCRWQTRPDALRACDVIVGCVDGFAERRELEACARRHLIPYLDIGLDVHQTEGEPPEMAGQIILSMPGHPCMRCLGFLSDSNLGREAARYGMAGIRPQVVWANGILASTAVGLLVDLVTGWTRKLRPPVYLSYEANRGTVEPHARLPYVSNKSCEHYPMEAVGAPRFEAL
jgi:hypothetical protein